MRAEELKWTEDELQLMVSQKRDENAKAKEIEAAAASSGAGEVPAGDPLAGSSHKPKGRSWWNFL